MRILKNGGATYDRIIKNLYYLCKTQPKIKVHLRVNYNSETINNIPKFLSELPNEVRQNAYIYIAEIYHCSAFLGESGEASGSTVAARINDRLPLTKREKLGITMLCLKCKSPGEAHSGLINFPMKPRPAYCEADYSNNFVVDPLGDLFKCTVSFQQELKVGQIRKDGKAIFNLPNLSIWLSKDPFSQRKCRNCRVLPICMGGCRSSSAKMSNSRCSAPLTHKDLVVALQLLYENGLLNGQCAQ